MSGSSDLRNLAARAERDLNSQRSKTGQSSSSDDSGVDTSVESKFPGSKVQYGDDLTTSASYNRIIPVEEGGDLDDKGRSTRGNQFEGTGAPEDNILANARDHGGDDDVDVKDTDGSNKSSRAFESQKSTLAEGLDASRANMSKAQQKPQFKGEDYYTPESVEDSIADQGNVPPGSVTQASRDS